MFSSMKNVFIDDIERGNIKNKMISLVQEHYNDCTEKLDRLKSEVETTTDKIIEPYRIY